MDEDSGLMNEDGPISKSYWFYYHRYKFIAALGIVPVLVVSAVILGLIPLYISSGSSGTSTATATNTYDKGWTRLVNTAASGSAKKRQIIGLGANDLKYEANENTTNLDLTCGRKKYKLGGAVNKGFKEMKKQDTIGKTIKNAKIAYGCKNSQVEQTLSYDLESGMRTFVNTEITGNYYNQTDVIGLYERFMVGEAEVAIARDFRDKEKSKIAISGEAYNARTGLMGSYNGCIFDTKGVSENLATCYSVVCMNPALCTIIQSGGSTTSEVDGTSTKKGDEVGSKTTTTKDGIKTTNGPSVTDPDEKIIGPRTYDVVSELVEYTYVMEIGYTDTVMEIVATNFDEDADTEMSNNNDSVESVEEMVV